MNDVSGIGGASAASALNASSGATSAGRHPGARAQFLDELFAMLDTKQQGYLDKTGLANALAHANGGAATNGTATNVDDLFAKLDTNGDGKVTKQEMSDVLATLDEQLRSMRVDRLRQQLPDDGGAGLNQDQIAALASRLGPTDGGRAAVLRDLAENFSVADTNGDGRISRGEAMQYAQSKPAEAISGAAVANGTDRSALASASDTVVRQLAQLLHAYGTFGTGGLMQAVSKGLSVIA